MAPHCLATVRVRVSCVLPAPLGVTWDIVRDWQCISSWFDSVDSLPLVTEPVESAILDAEELSHRVSLLIASTIQELFRRGASIGEQTGTSSQNIVEAGAATEVGCLRRITIGQGQLYEQLLALDDDEHFVRWTLVSHPGTVNPFKEASFKKYLSTMRLYAVTIGNQTFLEWTGSFSTEPMFAQAMTAKLHHWYSTGLEGLKAFLMKAQLATWPVDLRLLMGHYCTEGVPYPHLPSMPTPAASCPSAEPHAPQPKMHQQTCPFQQQSTRLKTVVPDPGGASRHAEVQHKATSPYSTQQHTRQAQSTAAGGASIQIRQAEVQVHPKAERWRLPTGPTGSIGLPRLKGS